MFANLIRVLDEATQTPLNLDRMAGALPSLLEAANERKMTDAEVPCARYIVHNDHQGRYNIQLDTFSKGYTGGIHAHETWGMVLILRGGLWVEDFQEYNGKVERARVSWMGAGGGQVFCPPVSDWHRVGTRAEGLQTVSFHIYGPRFDLENGLGIGPDGQPRRYKRGVPGDNNDLKRLFV